MTITLVKGFPLTARRTSEVQAIAIRAYTTTKREQAARELQRRGLPVPESPESVEQLGAQLTEALAQCRRDWVRRLQYR